MRNLSIIILSLLFLGSVGHAQAQNSCASQAIDQTTASAGTWANMRKNPGSLRYESERLLNEGYRRTAAGKSAAGAGSFVMKAIPKVFLTQYGDSAKCAAKLEQTSRAPFEFNGLVFPSVDKLAAWFGDFSQGSGTEGKKLYAMCDGACSPQYTIYVTPQGGQIEVRASVVCGPARDKSDDNFDLSIAACS